MAGSTYFQSLSKTENERKYFMRFFFPLKSPSNLFRRLNNCGQFLKCLMLVQISLISTGNHVNDYMWMFSSNRAILQISIRLAQMIIVYAIQVIHSRRR